MSRRTSSPPPPPPLAPTTVPYIIDAEFENWLNGATVDALHNFYTHVLLPEYEKINIPYKTMYTEGYTKIYNRIIAQTTGIKYVVNLVSTRNDQERIKDVEALKDVIKNMIRQIIFDRANRASKQIPSSSMQSEPMITVRRSSYMDLERQLAECQRREFDAKKLSDHKNALERQIQDAYNAYHQFRIEGVQSATSPEGRDYDVIADDRDQAKRRFEMLQQQQQQQQQQGRGGRSKRVKRVKRSKRVKHSKRSSTKRH